VSEHYYHGGIVGLEADDVLLPPAHTRAVSISDVAGWPVCRRDRVYLTPDLEEARVYAGLTSGRGDVYEVVPVGELEREHAGSFMAPAARITAVVERGVDKRQALERIEVDLARARRAGAA
jgi:hypothetical protein